jgi:fructose-1,6-bisphosphatase/inositol monophosphatase family enzyme
MFAMTTMTLDIDRVSALIQETAEAEILPRFRNLAAGDIRTKSGPQDLVTAADLASEERLALALRAQLPGSIVVGEEGAFADPGLIDRLAGGGTIWVIDPIDGTTNFAEGKPDFAVIVGLVRDGEIVAGWIHDVLAGETAVATKGAGAWIGTRRLRVKPPATFEAMTGAVYVGAKRAPALHERVKALRPLMAARSYLRSAGAEYLALVRGASHYALFTRLMPWDHVAGHLIHAEAGGYAACLDGAPYRPRPIEGTLLLAPDRATWHALERRFTGD